MRGRRRASSPLQTATARLGEPQATRPPSPPAAARGRGAAKRRRGRSCRAVPARVEREAALVGPSRRLPGPRVAAVWLPSVLRQDRGLLVGHALPRVAAAWLLSALLLASAPSAQAQRWASDPYESRLLREASALETRGDLDGAEEKLRELARRRPESSAAVFALERVLRAAGRLDGLAPIVAAHLEANPGAASVRSLELRVLRDVDSLAAVDAAVKRWIRADPAAARPYREGADAFAQAGDVGAAAALLERGIDALGPLPALLLALGDARAASGAFEETARAWSAAVAADGARVAEVLERLGDLDAGREEVVRAMLDAGAAWSLGASRPEVAAEIALREGREDEARTLVEQGTRGMDAIEARGFVRAFARKAEDLERWAVAVWAYERLRETAAAPAEARATDERLAEAALAAGDTSAAAAALRRVREAHPPKSPERRAAWAAEVRLRLALGGADEGREAFEAFRQEFADASEVGELAAVVAAALIEAGDKEAAFQTLDGAAGAGAGIERAFLFLEAGAVLEGAEALLGALPGLDPAEATRALGLAQTIGRLGPNAARVAARVAVAGRRRTAADAVQAAQEGLSTVAPAERPPILALAARTADEGGLAEAAEDFRRRIVAEHLESDELPEAALLLAKAVAGRPGGAPEAMRILEDLIVARPGSAIVPEARRELNRLRAAGGTALHAPRLS